ncbi:MAG: lipid-A-disaccharide synthase [Pseudomonadota bacterium]
MADANAITIGIVAGEESGQLLAADLLDALQVRLGRKITLLGVGGSRLERFGLKSLFEADEIALTGVTSVVARAPKLLARIRQTADVFIAAAPEIVLFIDSPDFSARVARRLKAARPATPTVKYVCPTVWAWRPGRAAKMVELYDHVLALFPFEPSVMEDLGGPPTTYVGHRLLSDDRLMRVWDERRQRVPSAAVTNLLLLPGSRRAEIDALLPDMEATVKVLSERGHALCVTIPAVERHALHIRDAVAGWPADVMVKVVSGDEAKIAAYRNADVAIAASGTVLLELAIAGIPAISLYRVDPLMKPFIKMITSWSMALPNIIADRVVINEYYDQLIHPPLLARLAEELAAPVGPKRDVIMDGYVAVRETMALDNPSSDTAAAVLQNILQK